MKLKQFIFASMAMLWSFVSPTFAQVAKVGNTEYATIVQLPDGMDDYESLFGTNTVTDGTNYYATLQAAVEAVAGMANTVLYCKPGADVGALQHAPVVSTLTIYGNGASVTGFEHFDLGNTDKNENSGLAITADMTLTIKNLNGLSVWGAKATTHEVSVVINDCEDLGKVFISGTTGTLNLTMTNCEFKGREKEAVYTNADGAITLTNVAFSNLNKAINLNHKAAGTQTVTIDGCSFTDCGNDVAADQIPVRVLSSVAGGKSVLTVNNTTFTGTPEGGADILLDYGVGVTEATVTKTAANVKPENKEGNAEMVAVTAATEYTYTNVLPVAQIGTTPYNTLAEAVAAAQNDATITLIADVKLSEMVTIPAGKTITLDLAGHEIVGGWNGNSTTNHIYALENKGELTVKSTVENGMIISRGIYNYGKLTLNSGTINACDGNGGYAVNNKSGSTFVMNGGTLIASYEDDYQSSNGGYDATALNVPSGCTATLNGGTITDVCDFTFAIAAAGTLNVPETSTVLVQGNHGAVSVSGGETTINAGTYKVIKDDKARTDNVMYVSGGALVINGGTFIGDSDTASGGSCLYDKAGKAVVNGGTFKGSSGGDVWGTTGTTIKGGTFENLIEKQHIAAGYVALPDLSGNFVVGTQPTATVNNLGMTTVAAGNYAIWNGSFDSNTEDDGDMPLSFVMQFLADQNAEDMKTSPYADWYGDFVLTFTGIENGSFTANDCYLAGHYGSFGWVKVPVDGMIIEEGARYPVMLGVGLGQKYDYICSSVEDFRCALYLTPKILEANPNIQVKLELGLVDNSQGSDKAASALINNENVYSVKEYTYRAEDFVAKEELVIVDGDGKDFDNASDKHVDTFKYTRTFANSGVWNAMYLPVAIPMNAIDPDKYEIAYINDVHSEDLNGDGQININQDKMWMEVVKITNNAATLTAYGPYVIKAKTDEAKNFELTLENVTVKAAEEITYDCSSMSHKFNIQGTCRKRTKDELAGGYVVSTKGGWVTSTSAMKPFRFYMTITDRWGNPVNVDASESQLMRIKVRGEEDTTEIDGVECNTNSVDQIFDLQGRHVATPVKGGIYIVNGKKVLFNK